MAARSSGGPVDPDLRVTLNFHPDRLVLAGGLLVCVRRRSGRYDQQDLKRVWHYVARFGSPDGPAGKG